MGQRLWTQIWFVSIDVNESDEKRHSSHFSSTEIPLHKFHLFQQMQYLLKIVHFLLSKFDDLNESNDDLSVLVDRILDDGSSFVRCSIY